MNLGLVVWEYEVATETEMKREKLELNDYGAKGWELVSVAATWETAGTLLGGTGMIESREYEFVYFFKRPKR